MKLVKNRLLAAWYCLCGREVIYRVDMNGNHLNIYGHALVIDCKFYQAPIALYNIQPPKNLSKELVSNSFLSRGQK